MTAHTHRRNQISASLVCCSIRHRTTLIQIRTAEAETRKSSTTTSSATSRQASLRDPTHDGMLPRGRARPGKVRALDPILLSASCVSLSRLTAPCSCSRCWSLLRSSSS